MAQKDYVARSQKKKTAPRKKKQAVQPVAWIKVLFAIFIVGAFGVGLWYLKDAGKNQHDNTEDTVVKDDTKPEAANKEVVILNDAPSKTEGDDALPELEDEEWEFIEGLPAYSVEVDTDEIADSGRLYKMQCGSFRTNAQAEVLRANIALHGLEAVIQKAKGTKSIWYQVSLGPYKQKRLADYDRSILRRGGISGCEVWNWE